MAHKHIDPQPHRRYIIQDVDGEIDSATVINATDRFVRLHWDRSGDKKWYDLDWFFPFKSRLVILEELET